MRPRLRLPVFIGCHLIVSAAAASMFAWRFGHHPRSVLSHVLLLAEWDVMLAALSVALAALISPTIFARLTCRSLLVVTFTLQVYLYVLHAASNLSWGRNITGRVVTAFFPTVWSGKE